MTSTATGHLFTQAVALHRDGQHAQAVALYERVLAADPHHLDALYNLGLLHRALGRLAPAAHCLFEAVQRAPEHAGAWRALALVMRAMRHADAEVALRRALRDTPADAELSAELGLALIEAGRFADAEPVVRAAADAHPGNAILPFALGSALQGQGRFAEAAAAYRRCLAVDREMAPAHNNLGLVLLELDRPRDGAAALRRAVALNPTDAGAFNSLGTCLERQGCVAGSETAYRRALRLRPDYFRAVANLGHSLAGRHEHEAASACRRRAIVVQPDAADPYTALGSAAQEWDRLAEAEGLHRRALRLDPRHLAALTNLGVVRQIRGCVDEATGLQRHCLVLEPACADALANLGLLFWLKRDRTAAERCLSRALLLDGSQGPAHLNRGMIRLERGDLAGGWPEYQWRFRAKGYTDRAIAAPPWRGEELTSKRILVWREQGVGDEILFSSCYADLMACAGQVVIECDARLVGLFARSFPAALVRAETAAADGSETVVPPDADVHAPSGRLPMFLRGRLAAFPPRAGWLVADPARVAAWRERLEALGPGVRVGIAWRSQLMTTDRQAAYTRIEQWAPVFAVPGVHFVSLQYDDCAAELMEAERRFGVTLHRWPDHDLKNDFEGTAALIANLDLVVSPATSVGELAAALATPTWRLGAPDWTQLGSAIRPWFPAMRLFQPRPGETLADTLSAVARHLHRLTEAKQDRASASEAAAEPDVEATVQAAIGRYRAGDLRGGAALADEALAVRPRHPVAHHLLGVIRKRQGDAGSAVTHFAAAAAAEPGNAAANAGLADALRLLGRADAAEAAQRNAIAAQPDAAEHWVNHTAALRSAGRPGEAERACRRALRLRPDLALAHTHLGSLLAASGRRDRAVVAHRRALTLDPGFAEGHSNLGTALLALERFADAATALQRAVMVNGGLAVAWTNLGNACSALGRAAEAEAHHRKAIALDAGLADAHSNLALLLHRQRRPDDAMQEYRQALAADPKNAQAHYNLAFLLLEHGNLRSGWQEHEWRFATREQRAHDRRFAMRAWRGENVSTARVLVWREQGLGDELMFASCYADLIARARHVVIECEPRLVTLFARAFPAATVRAPTPDPRDADVHVPAGSLPRVLRADLRRFPERASWLVAEAGRTRAWAERLAALGPGLRVGIGWRSSLMTHERRGAYTALDAWGPVLTVPGVHFVNLQYDDCVAEIAQAEARFGVPIHRWADVDLRTDLEGAAALVANLDLVISPAMSAGELAGALGVPVWRFGTVDWTQLGAAVRPWFPAMRLFPPRRGETLGGVLLRIGRELRRLVQVPPPEPAPAPVPDPDSLLEEAAGHHQRGDLAAAAPLYARVLDRRPNDPVALHLSGLLAHQTGDHDTAVARIGAALGLLPGYAAAHLSRGSALLALERAGEAAFHFASALALEPDKAAALTNLGNALEAQHRPEAAERWHRRALAAAPALAEAHDNLGAVLLRLGRPGEAERAHRAALALAPGLSSARLNLGVALRQLARPAEALARYREALALAPDVTDALGNLVRLLREAGRVGEAETWGRRALALDPRHPAAHFNIGLLKLARGELAAGWAGYDHRFRDRAYTGAVRRVPAPPWQGEDLTGKRILVWPEQGIGDEILFGSCLPDLVARAGRVVVECDPRLVSLLARSLPAAEVRATADGEPPPVDVHTPIGSLPRRLRPELTAYPARLAYLTPDPARVARWRERLAALGPGLKVGIGWRSALMTAERAAAYTRLDAWGPVLAVPGVRFVNLQYDDCAAEIAAAEARLRVSIHRWPDLDLRNDLEGVAALMASLDLVVSPAMSVGELAAAVGTPVWRFGTVDWTQLGTAVRPWFPAMRLFPPRPGETLSDVLARIGRALHGMVSEAGR